MSLILRYESLCIGRLHYARHRLILRILAMEEVCWCVLATFSGRTTVAKQVFKTSGIARSGFEYQDLIGIDVLLRFYRDPDIFYWVELEAENTKAGKLDDVIAARRDNSFELLQVKFTADTDRFLHPYPIMQSAARNTNLDAPWCPYASPHGRSISDFG